MNREVFDAVFPWMRDVLSRGGNGSPVAACSYDDARLNDRRWRCLTYLLCAWADIRTGQGGNGLLQSYYIRLPVPDDSGSTVDRARDWADHVPALARHAADRGGWQDVIFVCRLVRGMWPDNRMVWAADGRDWWESSAPEVVAGGALANAPPPPRRRARVIPVLLDEWVPRNAPWLWLSLAILYLFLVAATA